MLPAPLWMCTYSGGWHHSPSCNIRTMGKIKRRPTKTVQKIPGKLAWVRNNFSVIGGMVCIIFYFIIDWEIFSTLPKSTWHPSLWEIGLILTAGQDSKEKQNYADELINHVTESKTHRINHSTMKMQTAVGLGSKHGRPCCRHTSGKDCYAYNGKKFDMFH